MLDYDMASYRQMLGNICINDINSATCIGQCTGCMCSCKCSCSGSCIEDDLEWEEI